MGFITLIIAVVAIIVAVQSRIELSDLKLDVSRLRRDLNRSLSLSEPDRLTSARPDEAKAVTPSPTVPVSSASDPVTPQPSWVNSSPVNKQAVPKLAIVKGKSFEERLGTQWTVWVGGLALFLGAVFLLRYSIEAGVFTPLMRLSMAVILGLVLLTVGDGLYRIDRKGGAGAKFVKIMGLKPSRKTGALTIADKTDAPRNLVADMENIPAILTAIGLFVLLGAAYSAYGLYDLIETTPAFLLLGALSLGAIALSLRHGQVLAALGLAASLATPLLVKSQTPSVYILYGYLIIIAVAAITVSRMRIWGWLTVLTLFSLLGWSCLSGEAALSANTTPIWYGFLGLSFAATAYLAKAVPVKQTASLSVIGPVSGPVSGLASSDEAEKTKPVQTNILDIEHTPVTALIWGAIAAVLIISTFYHGDIAGNPPFKRLDYQLGLTAALVFFSASYYWPAQRAHVYSGAIIGAFTLFAAHAMDFQRPQIIVTGCIISACVMALTTAPKLGAPFVEKRGLYPAKMTYIDSVFAVGFPSALFIALWYMQPGLSKTVTAALLLVFALANAALAYLLRRKKAFNVEAAIFALGSALGYLLASLLLFEGMALGLALMLGLVIALGLAWILGDTILRIFVPAFAGLSALHTLCVQIPNSEMISTTPIFNALWIYLALPAVLCFGAAWCLGRKERDLWSEGLNALGLAFAALFLVFQIRHLMNGGNVLATRLSFDELAIQVLTGLCFTLGGAKIGNRASKHWVYNPKADIETALIPALMTGLSLFTLIVFALGVCVGKSPLFMASEFVNGNLLLNSLVLGYLFPALLLGAIAWIGRQSRPQWYLRLVAGLAAVSAVMYVTTLIRFGFQGSDIALSTRFPEGLELYAISIAWLLMGIGTLMVGMKTDHQTIRLASALLITLTVLKAFLIDMASLEGVLRAMSFVVLGVVLIIIGRVYQKLLARPQRAD